MGIFGSWILSTAALVAGCVQNPPPAQWQQPQQAPPPPYSQSSEAQPYPAPQPYQQPYPAPARPAATYTPCQYMCGTMSRCQLHAYDACVTECKGTGAENTDNGRRVLDSFARMTCEQLAAELRASNTAASPPPVSAPATPPPLAPPAVTSPPTSSSVAAGRWVSAPHQSYTNAAYVSADFHLDITIASTGGFRGSWARYVCAGAAYAGILSCGKGGAEGSVSGQLDANGSGWIELHGVGRSTLTWFASSASDVQLTLPQSWQGDKVLYRSKIKR